METNKRIQLENKAWYRGVKVLYILFISISFLFLVLIAVITMPEKTIDRNSSYILCYNGKTYATTVENGFSLYGSQKDLNYSDDKNARILCKSGVGMDFEHLIPKNNTNQPLNGGMFDDLIREVERKNTPPQNKISNHPRGGMFDDIEFVKNYTFVPKYSQVEYGEWFGGSVLAFFVICLISYLTKIIFFYIAIGEKPKIKIPY